MQRDKNILFKEYLRKTASKKRGKGIYDVDKSPIFTIVHRKTKHTVFLVLKNLEKAVGGIVDQFVDNESVIYIDEYVIYNNLINHEKVTNHHTVNHGDREYVNREVNVNNDENKHLLRKLLKIF